MVLNIIGRNKVYSKDYHIGKSNFATRRKMYSWMCLTLMDIKEKTKDTNKSQLDVVEICNWKELELKDIGHGKLIKPKPAYAFTKSQRVFICKWFKELKIPNGYASNLGRCVDLNQKKLHELKCYNHHVSCKWLPPIAFDSLPKSIWKVLAELSLFFKELSSTTLNVEHLRVMEEDIHVLLCKLKQVFSPSFFDSTEHCPIHLLYETKVCDPFQYCWMYPFEWCKITNHFYTICCLFIQYFKWYMSISFLGSYTP